jgi:elongation factor P--(R)-beta-lysine ligase
MMETEVINWQPTATLANLKKRATILASIREFFNERGVWEVETPVLSHSTVTAPYVVGIPAIFQIYGSTKEQICYLQTSPEYAMKRLLAAGSGPIFQITKSFRQGEVGKLHNPEFTMLEWYRPGFDHHALMNEMDALLQKILGVAPAERASYAELFQQHFGIDAHAADVQTLTNCARDNNIPLTGTLPDRDAWLDLLWTHGIEPKVGKSRPLFLYDFPQSQAALAKVRPGQPPLASRFEVYFKGIELANGFHELQDANEQEKRFREDLFFRNINGLPAMPVDERFLAALTHGLPDCAGVALGVDRLVMLALDCKKISDVLSFSFEHA